MLQNCAILKKEVHAVQTERVTYKTSVQRRR